MRAFLCVIASTFAAFAVFAQTADPPPRFMAADVHPSPLTGIQVARGPYMSGARYDVRNATMVDLIVRAYGVNADKVLDGRSWLEYDRFDVSALMPTKSSAADAKLMLQGLLKDRFQLAIRSDNSRLSVHALTAPKGKQKLEENGGSAET